MRPRERAFQDRRDAGRVLARTIQASGISCDCQDGIVLGLPRGGVPVAYEVAHTLGLPLDIFVVRKLEVPSLGELAMGMVASDGTVAINSAIVQELHISEEAIEAEVEPLRDDLKRFRNRLGFHGSRTFSHAASGFNVFANHTGTEILQAIKNFKASVRGSLRRILSARNPTP